LHKLEHVDKFILFPGKESFDHCFFVSVLSTSMNFIRGHCTTRDDRFCPNEKTICSNREVFVRKEEVCNFFGSISSQTCRFPRESLHYQFHFLFFVFLWHYVLLSSVSQTFRFGRKKVFKREK
jgi:hypothetical protein